MTTMLDEYRKEGRDDIVAAVEFDLVTIHTIPGGGQPLTFDDLMKSVERGTTDGILQLAVPVCDREQFATLEAAVKRVETAKRNAPLPKTRRRRR